MSMFIIYEDILNLIFQHVGNFEFPSIRLVSKYFNQILAPRITFKFDIHARNHIFFEGRQIHCFNERYIHRIVLSKFTVLDESYISGHASAFYRTPITQYQEYLNCYPYIRIEEVRNKIALHVCAYGNVEILRTIMQSHPSPPNNYIFLKSMVREAASFNTVEMIKYITKTYSVNNMENDIVYHSLKYHNFSVTKYFTISNYDASQITLKMIAENNVKGLKVALELLHHLGDLSIPIKMRFTMNLECLQLLHQHHIFIRNDSITPSCESSIKQFYDLFQDYQDTIMVDDAFLNRFIKRNNVFFYDKNCDGSVCEYFLVPLLKKQHVEKVVNNVPCTCATMRKLFLDHISLVTCHKSNLFIVKKIFKHRDVNPDSVPYSKILPEEAIKELLIKSIKMDHVDLFCYLKENYSNISIDHDEITNTAVLHSHDILRYLTVINPLFRLSEKNFLRIWKNATMIHDAALHPNLQYLINHNLVSLPTSLKWKTLNFEKYLDLIPMSCEILYNINTKTPIKNVVYLFKRNHSDESILFNSINFCFPEAKWNRIYEAMEYPCYYTNFVFWKQMLKISFEKSNMQLLSLLVRHCKSEDPAYVEAYTKVKSMLEYNVEYLCVYITLGLHYGLLDWTYNFAFWKQMLKISFEKSNMQLLSLLVTYGKSEDPAYVEAYTEVKSMLEYNVEYLCVYITLGLQYGLLDWTSSSVNYSSIIHKSKLETFFLEIHGVTHIEKHLSKYMDFICCTITTFQKLESMRINLQDHAIYYLVKSYYKPFNKYIIDNYVTLEYVVNLPHYIEIIKIIEKISECDMIKACCFVEHCFYRSGIKNKIIEKIKSSRMDFLVKWVPDLICYCKFDNYCKDFLCATFQSTNSRFLDYWMRYGLTVEHVEEAILKYFLKIPSSASQEDICNIKDVLKKHGVEDEIINSI